MSKETLHSLVGVRPLSLNKFESIRNPASMGNTTGIAYGGCAIANAIHAAYSSLPSQSTKNAKNYHLYSILGHFLGPALTDRKITCSTFPHRTTRTFFSLRVELSQLLDSGEDRRIMVVLADFMVPEPSLPQMIYSAPPFRSYSPVSAAPSAEEALDRERETGAISSEQAEMFGKTFGLLGRFFEQRRCPEGVFAQNMAGMCKERVTSQDRLALTEKTSGEWLRVKSSAMDVGEGAEEMGPAEQHAAMGFVQDGALSFVPLSHEHLFLDDAGACSSLDFGLRFFAGGGGLNMRDWHLREMRTVVGAEGRTYTESRMWDERGSMVSSMTQQSIMRVKKGEAPKL